jgi:hypothetical protein
MRVTKVDFQVKFAMKRRSQPNFALIWNSNWQDVANSPMTHPKYVTSCGSLFSILAAGRKFSRFDSKIGPKINLPCLLA